MSLVQKTNKVTGNKEYFECASKRKANEFKRQLKYELNVKNQLHEYDIRVLTTPPKEKI